MLVSFIHFTLAFFFFFSFRFGKPFDCLAHRHTIHEAFFGEGPSLGPDHISSPTSNGTGQNGSPPQPSRSISSLDLPWGTDLDLLTPVQPRDVDCRLSGVLTGSGVLVGE